MATSAIKTKASRPISGRGTEQCDLDLTKADGTRAYLETHLLLDVESITPLSGGYCNFGWRVKLLKPYEYQESIVVKHAEPFAAADLDKSAKMGVERLVSGEL